MSLWLAACSDPAAGPGLEPPFGDDGDPGAMAGTGTPVAGGPTTPSTGTAGDSAAGAGGGVGGAGGSGATGGVPGAATGGTGGAAVMDASVPEATDGGVLAGDAGPEAPVDCDVREITCTAPPPVCEEGTVASVDDGGCYGPCVVAERCGCDASADCPAGYICQVATGHCGPDA